jgi:hypothetical protein
MEVRSAEAIFSALNAADVKYLVVGGLAVNAYGYERLTRHIDLVIGLEPENIIRGASRIARPWLSHVNPGHSRAICRSGESRGVAKRKKHDSAQALE